jgi:SAM-dependent methyltransferase
MVEAPPKKACNSFVARVLDLRLRSHPSTVVFEGGAGVGATLREALQIPGFRERADRIALYGFTDISRPLMRRARDTLLEMAPETVSTMRFDRVDLDILDDYDDLPYLQDGATDIVIFESVLHDVENLHRVLTTCRRILKPGGWLAFTVGSRGRPGMFFPCELLQSTLHSYYRGQQDPPRRVNVGYLSIDEWKTSLIDAGFTEFRIYPEIDDHEKWPYGGIVARSGSSDG